LALAVAFDGHPGIHAIACDNDGYGFFAALDDLNHHGLMAAGRPNAAVAAKSVTTSIPIVFDNSADPCSWVWLRASIGLAGT
jgi:hypothetical protein